MSSDVQLLNQFIRNAMPLRGEMERSSTKTGADLAMPVAVARRSPVRSTVGEEQGADALQTLSAFFGTQIFGTLQ